MLFNLILQHKIVCNILNLLDFNNPCIILDFFFKRKKISTPLISPHCIIRDYQPHHNPKHFNNFLTFLGTQCTIGHTCLALCHCSQLCPVSQFRNSCAVSFDTHSAISYLTHPTTVFRHTTHPTSSDFKDSYFSIYPFHDRVI